MFTQPTVHKFCLTIDASHERDLSIALDLVSLIHTDRIREDENVLCRSQRALREECSEARLYSEGDPIDRDPFVVISPSPSIRQSDEVWKLLQFESLQVVHSPSITSVSDVQEPHVLLGVRQSRISIVRLRVDKKAIWC